MDKLKIKIKIKNWDGSWTEDDLYNNGGHLVIDTAGFSNFEVSLNNGVLELDPFYDR